MIGLQLVQDAFIMAGIQMAGEPLAAQDAVYGNTKLNQLLSQFSVNVDPQWASTTISFTLTGGVSEYTIGPGGLIDQPRPQMIQTAQFSLSNGTPVNVNLVPLSPADFQSLSMPTINSIPIYYSYNPTFPLGTLNLYPVPVSNYPLKLTYIQSLSDAGLNTNYQLPPGYELMIISNLACLLCIAYTQQASPELKQLASSTYSNIVSANQANLSINPGIDGSVPGMRGSNQTPWAWPGIIQI